jgi:hypothetical protein
MPVILSMQFQFSLGLFGRCTVVEGRTVVKGRVPVGPTTTTVPVGPMGGEELEAMNAWWRTANYLALGQKVLRLLAGTRVPLTKNVAEKSLRMVELHDKILGP